MTPGQDQAVEELSRIVAAIPGTVVVGSIEEVGDNLVAVVGLDCRGFEHAEGGVRVRQREWFDITVPPRFPFKPPRADVRHTRWEHVPHVQWRRHLCLYVAPGVEWNAADGMYGFFGRLDQWIRQAALGQLDPVAGPQHPPVAYPTTGTPLFIPRADTPDFDGPWWAGFGELTSLAEYRHDIVGWHAVGTLPPGDYAVAATVLLKERLPFEFPEKLGDLIGELERAKFTKDLLYLLLGVAAYRINEGAPLYVIVGTPMRSTSSGERAAAPRHLAPRCGRRRLAQDTAHRRRRQRTHPRAASWSRRGCRRVDQGRPRRVVQGARSTAGSNERPHGRLPAGRLRWPQGGLVGLRRHWFTRR